MSAKKKPGAIFFYLGFAIIALAIGCTLVFDVYIGGPLIVGALALLVRGLTATGRRASGEACAACGRTIVVEHQAELCTKCDRAVHAACARDHTRSAHAIETGQPFR